MAGTAQRGGADRWAHRRLPASAQQLASTRWAETEPQVSVVISTRGRSALWPQLLMALQDQDLGTDHFEVVVVDDGSADPTWAVLEEAVDKDALALMCARVGRSAGQGAGRNLGISLARAPIVAFTDDDCVPPPSWLATLVAPFGDSAPRPVVVQGRTTPTDFDKDSAGPWARTVWVLKATWLFETCNIAYRREDLERAGGFPDRDEAPHDARGKALGEDALLGWEVVDGGSELVFAPDAQTYHRHHRASYRQWLLEHRGRAVFPDLAARNPMARRALWHSWFLAPRSAAFDLGLLSVVAWSLTRRARFLLGLVPWVWMALPEAAQRSGRHPAVRLVQIGAGDLVGNAALYRASAKHRSFVG